jgi:hypothetical protein
VRSRFNQIESGSDPDTSTFTSTTNFTRAPLGPDGLYFSVYFGHRRRLAWRGTNIIEHFAQIQASLPAAHFVRQQFGHPAVIRQTHFAGLLEQSLRQIQFNSDTHNVILVFADSLHQSFGLVTNKQCAIVSEE